MKIFYSTVLTEYVIVSTLIFMLSSNFPDSPRTHIKIMRVGGLFGGGRRGGAGGMKGSVQ